MQIILHQTHHKLADLRTIFSDLLKTVKLHSGQAKKAELHVYPESYLTGYPLQDMVLQQEFIQSYLISLESLDQALKEMPANDNLLFLVGGLDYRFSDDKTLVKQELERIENVIYALRPGVGAQAIYTKRLLPNYDIFDEKKYFSPGSKTGLLDFAGHHIALLICEDMWFDNTHKIDPIRSLIEKKKDQAFDLIVNLSASPYFKGKKEKRLARVGEISTQLQAPFVYVNRVGAEDEILFDGSSFVMCGNQVVTQAQSFTADQLTLDLPMFTASKELRDHKTTWAELYETHLDSDDAPQLALPSLTDKQCLETVQAITFGLSEYMNKCHFDHVSIALSGGLDSALVLALCHLTLKDPSKIEAIYMPSQFSSDLSRELCEELCANLGIRLRHFPIKFLHSTLKGQFAQHLGSEVTGLADENIQSRLRGLLMYARSNQNNAMILNTSNKSELAVGYSTLYGDSVGALSLLGDLFKSQVFDLARYLAKSDMAAIPKELIERPPSAELRADQKDSDSLPPYERLDALLEGLLSYQKSPADLIDLGFDREEITRVSSLYKKSEYKRTQFCPILKLEAKSFGFGYRVPITKKLTVFTN
jgi:NAD+ synthase (glutamine-hydrolysing)